ncbi:porin [Candidatus Puniceispirillum sp.]|uniref:porin n=1 Tax=Candidatus Puniceispirillum sp. TaxID=2026719 RepID=UPI001ED052F6|nr:porin [Candidatus Puniceispirillum sp.]
MRKVLLATTALVALGGVSAASADVSLSASASWAYDSWSDDTAAATASGLTTNNTSATMDSDFTISGSTTADSGMSFGGSIHVDDGVDDDARMHISDDWGQISFGEHNDAAKSSSAGQSAFDAALSGSSSISSTTTPALTTGLGTATVVGSEAKGQVMYTSPTVNGLTVRVSQADAGAASKADSTAIGVTYAIDVDGVGITAHYATYDVSSSGDVATGTGSYETDQDGFGVKIVYGDFTVRAASMDKDVKQGGSSIGTAGYEASTSDYGITYAMSDTVTLEAVAMSSELSTSSTNGGDSYEATQVGVKYVPATGMYVSLTNRSYEMKDSSAATTNDGANTRLKVGVTF